MGKIGIYTGMGTKRISEAASEPYRITPYERQRIENILDRLPLEVIIDWLEAKGWDIR